MRNALKIWNNPPFQVMQLSGVQGVQDTHFWTLCSNYYVGGIKLEVRRNDQGRLPWLSSIVMGWPGGRQAASEWARGQLSGYVEIGGKIPGKQRNREILQVPERVL